MFIKFLMPSNNLVFCLPLCLLHLIFTSIGVFYNESVLPINWPKYWRFSLSIGPSNEYSGLISFRMDGWISIAVQGTLKNLVQHHSSKASVLQQSAFFMVQLSHPYITTRKSTALTIWIFVNKVMSLLFNMLFRVKAFLPRSKHLLILWLQSLSAVTLEPKKINKIGHCFHFFPMYLPWSDQTRCHDLSFFECWVLSQLFHFSLSPSSRGSLVPLHSLPLEWYHLHIWGCWYFSQ